jgi:3-oxoacyl-[acyl-carrier protein] reductase
MMDLQLTDKTALITAASKGIGAGAALALAQEGCRVIITSSNADNLAAAKAKIKSETEQDPVSLLMDMTDLKSVSDGVAKILTDVGRIDIAFLNAPGPAPMAAMDATDEDFLASLSTNLISQAAICRMVVPGMIEHKFGRIIALTSSTAKEPDPGMVLSNTARAGVGAYMKTLSREVAEHGITVNSILTGGVMSERTEFLIRSAADDAGQSYEEFLANVVQSIPTRHIPSPAEFATALVYLASPLSQCINGVSLPIDGGLMHAI